MVTLSILTPKRHVHGRIDVRKSAFDAYWSLYVGRARVEEKVLNKKFEQ
jgi:hypothetical protein